MVILSVTFVLKHVFEKYLIKKLSGTVPFVIVFCLFAVSRTFAEQAVHLVEDRGDCIVLKFKLPKYLVNDVVVNGEKCQSIVVPDAVYVSEKGAPQLPKFVQSIILPDNGVMELEIVAISCREISVDKIVPSRGVIYRNQNQAVIPYVFGEVYTTNAWYPEESASLSMPFIIRDFRGAVVCFYPFQYNPARKKLKIAKSITIKVKSANGHSIHSLYSTNKNISSAFERLYQRRFINFQNRALRYPEVNDGERMVVITAADYSINMEPFVAWKNRKGIKTDLYEYPDETGGSGADAVKSFILQKYDTDSISYILLVGDADDIPSLNGTVAGLSDPSYVKLAGDDQYPDAFIGRFSVEQPAHADHMVNKVLLYEKEPDQNGEWYAKAIGMATSEDGGTGVTDEEWVEEMCVAMENSMYTHVDRVYLSQNNTSAEVASALNEGRGWFNYQGHGLQTKFGFTNAFITNALFESLTNTSKLPVVICVACNTGEFDYHKECIAECATRLENIGAIVFLGSYIAQPWNPPQHGQKEIVRLLTEDTYVSLGAIVYNGSSKILEAGNSEGMFLETFEAWTLFGDPSLLVFNGKPTTMAVTCPERIETGIQEVAITFDDSIMGRVCLYSEENGILASKIFSNRESLTLYVEITNEKKIHLTVTARNRIPVMKEIAIGLNAIDGKNAFLNSNTFMVKQIGKSLMLHVPFTGKSIVTISDLQGRNSIRFETTANRKWFQIPESLSSGIHIVGIVVNDRAMTEKFLLVR